MRGFKAIAFVVVGVIMLSMVPVVFAQNSGREIVTTGTAVLNTKATILVLEMTVLGSGPTAADAQARGTSKADALISDFRRFGIKAEDWVKNQEVYRRPLPEEPKKMIFQVATSLVARLDDFSSAADMMDRATIMDAASVQFHFEVSDPQTEYERALKHALADARFRAEALAAEGGVKLGALAGCEEITAPPTPGPWAPSPAPIPPGVSAPSENIPLRQKTIDLRQPVVTTTAQVRARFAIAQ